MSYLQRYQKRVAGRRARPAAPRAPRRQEALLPQPSEHARLLLPLQEEPGLNIPQIVEEEEAKALPVGGGIFGQDQEFGLLPLQHEEQIEPSGPPSDIRTILEDLRQAINQQATALLLCLCSVQTFMYNQ